MSVSIVYETHSTTMDNENGIATGWLPGELSTAGRAQARELGERRRDDNIAAIYVSDLARALETVRIAFEGSAVPVVVDARLRECNYGRFNGMPAAQLHNERASHVDVAWPDGESYEEVVRRTRPLLADVLARWDNERVLLVGHSANWWALDHLLDGRDMNELVVRDFDWRPGWEYTLATNDLIG